jgi:hypothetical protein
VSASKGSLHSPTRIALSGGRPDQREKGLRPPAAWARATGGRGLGGRAGRASGEASVFPRPQVVAADVRDVAVVDEPVDEGGGHDVVAQHVPPLLEALVAGEERTGVLVAVRYELEEQRHSCAADGQTALVAERCLEADDRLLHGPRAEASHVRFEPAKVAGVASRLDAPRATGRPTTSGWSSAAPVS